MRDQLAPGKPVVDQPEHTESAHDGRLLIGLDIDGTIMTYDEFVSSEVKSAIAALRERGHHVVLSTGRPLVATLPVLAELGIDTGYAVCSNGSVTARLDPELPGGFEVDHAVMFPAEPAVAALGKFIPESLIALEQIGIGYYISEEFHSRKLHGAHTITALPQMRQMETARVVVARAQHASREFSDYVAQLGLRDTYYTVADEHWMDLAPQGITKAYGMERLRALLEVAPERTVAVGDSENDIEMLEWAHLGVAMGHAEASVIAAADSITLPIIDDGLAPVLEALLIPVH